MGKLNRAAIGSVVFCLSISLLFSSCKVDQSESPSEETQGTESSETSNSDTEQTDNTSSIENIEIDYPYDLSVQIVGSESDGDCTIIRYKDTEILIDTSLGDESIKAVTEILEEKKEADDHTWDYVIFTHPDKDHIGKVKELFKEFRKKERWGEEWKVGHLIDFGDEREEDQESDDERNKLKSYKEELSNLNDTEYYSPNGDLSPSKLTKEYLIDSRFKLTILYNEAYKKAYRNKNEDNELSVCCLFQIGEQKLLFTGDLEQDGEMALLKYHRELLRNVTFFKAGHHGSHTSNNKEFVDWIRPAYVAITYNSQIKEKALVNNVSRFLKYTDYIYPTVVKTDKDGTNPLFGNCSFDFNGKNVKVTSELNNNCTIKQAILKGTITSWYWDLVNDSRISDEINTYFFDESSSVNNVGELEINERAGNLSYYNCTLVKYGHYDILIDCGSVDFDSKVLVKKLRDYVVDGVIECVIVSHYHLPNYSQLIGESLSDDECVFKQFSVEKIIDNDVSMTNNYNTAGTAFSVYSTKVLSISDRISLKGDESAMLDICYGLKINVYRGSNSKQQDNEDDYSLVTVIEFNGNQMVFVGDLTDYSWFNSNYGSKLRNVRLMRFPSTYVEYSKMKGFDEFLKNAYPEVIVIGSPVNHWNNGQYFIQGNSVNSLITFLENSTKKRNIKIYSSGYVENNVCKSVFGDIDFTLFISPRIINKTAYFYYVSCRINGGSGQTNDKEVTDKLNTSYYAYVPDDLRKFPAIK